jgi:hypothetical protein
MSEYEYVMYVCIACAKAINDRFIYPVMYRLQCNMYV